MSEAGREVPKYTDMEAGDLLKALGDDASKWAEAFCQHADKLGIKGIEEGWMITWFANAIEHSSDVRRWRSRPNTTPVLDHELRG